MKYKYQIVNPDTGEVIEKFRGKCLARMSLHKLSRDHFKKLRLERIETE